MAILGVLYHSPDEDVTFRACLGDLPTDNRGQSFAMQFNEIHEIHSLSR